MLKRALSIIVAIAILCTMAIFAFAAEGASLSVDISDSDLRPGDKVTATVQLNNYADSWSAMSVDVKYDANLFALDAVRYEFFTAGIENAQAQVFEKTPGTIRFVWMGVENIDYDGTKLIELDLIAKEGAVANKAITAEFLADGQISTGSDGAPTQVQPSATTFSTAAASSAPIVVGGVRWEDQPYIEMDVEKVRPQIGRPFTATVKVLNYMPWDTLSVDFGYPAGSMEIQSVTPKDFAGDAVISGNNVTIKAAGDVAGGETIVAFDVELMPLAISDGAFNLTASFGSGNHSSEDGALVPDVHYKAEGSSKSITIVPAKTLLEVVYANPEQAANLQAGDTFDVYVSLKEHENEWAAFTLIGNYDPERFALKGIETEQYDYEYTWVEQDDAKGEVAVIWIDTENIKINDTNPRLMKLTFTALQAGKADISFAFKEDGVIAEGEDGNLTQQDKDENFTGSQEKVEVNVAPKPMQIVSSVVGGVTAVEAGHTFDIIVSVKDCYESLAALSIKGDYDKNLFEWVAVQPLLTAFGQNGEVITPQEGDDLEVVWLGTENVKLPSSFDAVRVTLRAKQAANAANINFSFIEGGVLNIGSDGLPAVMQGGTYYSQTPSTVTMNVSAPSVDLRVETDAKDVSTGDEFYVDVYVTDYYAPLAAFAIEGALNDQYFEVLEVVPQTVGGAIPMQDEDGELQFVWYSGDNIQTDALEFKVLTLKVRALKSADATQAITFDYMDGGMVRVGSNGATQELVRGEDFAEEPAKLLVPIAKKPVELGISFDKTEVRQGEEVTVAIDMKYYESDWVAFSFKTLFNTELFEYVDGSTVNGGLNAELVSSVDNATSPLAFSYLNTDLEPIEANWDNATIVTFKLKAKEDATIGEASVGVEFMQGGILDEDTNGVAHDGTAYVLGAIFKEIEIIDGFEPVALGLSFDKTEVRQGDEVTVTVNMENYQSNWMALAFKVNFDQFEVVEDSITNGDLSEEVIYSLDNETSPLAFAWLNTEMELIQGAEQAKLVSFKLRAKADAVLGETSVSVQFIEEGMLDGAGEYIAHDGEAYSTEKVAETIEILEGNLVQVNVTWGELSYVYNYGTWNTETHRWEGGSWTIAEDGEDEIGVSNVGNINIQAGFTYQSNAQGDGLTGAFALERNGDVFIDPISVDAGSEKTVYFSLRGKTAEEWDDTLSVGTITLTIDTANDGGAA